MRHSSTEGSTLSSVEARSWMGSLTRRSPAADWSSCAAASLSMARRKERVSAGRVPLNWSRVGSWSALCLGVGVGVGVGVGLG